MKIIENHFLYIHILLERYIGIRNPLKNREKSKTRTKFLIFSAWTVSFLLASPIIFLSYEDTSNIIQNGNCALFNAHFIIFGSIISFIVPLFIMILMYILTVRRLLKVVKDFKKKHQHEHPAIQALAKNKKFSVKFNDCRCDGKYFQKLSIKGILKKKKDANGSDANDSLIDESSHKFRNLVQKHRLINRTLTAFQNYRESTAVKNEQKAVKVLGIVFVIFVIAWGPFAIINILSAIFPKESIHPSLLDTLTWLGYVSSCINPIIYNAFNKKFRTAFKHVLFCRLKALRKSSQRRSHNKIMYPKSTNEKDISFQSSSRPIRNTHKKLFVPKLNL
ncbi:SERotonin octopamine receptor family [Brachionus plicatilis]|uniref:SERotonin octopamine receptor family n=1 Tax=Brachionus plicatilis TaxID=10195 RepID=A0A3M7QXK6_BRAPC|nr:SERotonin octopamine receptor family [Brachionus plicatilis]